MFVQQEGTSCRRYSHLTLRGACSSERTCCIQLARVELASCECEFYVLVADYFNHETPRTMTWGSPQFTAELVVDRVSRSTPLSNQHTFECSLTFNEQLSFRCKTRQYLH